MGEGREERRGEQRGCTWLVWKRDVDVEVEEAWKKKKKKNGVDALQGVQKMSIRVGFGE